MKAPLQITVPRLLASAPLGRRLGLRFCRLLAPLRRPAPLAASSPRLPARNAAAGSHLQTRGSRRQEALIPSLSGCKSLGSSALGSLSNRVQQLELRGAAPEPRPGFPTRPALKP
jgi:hypothetical protein